MTGILLLVGLALAWWHTRVQTYALALRPDSNQAYLAAGRYGVILLQLPEKKEGRTTGFVELSRFDTPGEAMDLAVASRRVYVADAGRGLRVIQVDGNTMKEVGALSPPPWAGKNPANALALQNGQYAFVGYEKAGVAVVDISDPQAPREVTRIPLNAGQVFDLAVQDNHLFIAAGEEGLLVYNVADPARPQPVVQGNQFNSQKIMGVDLLGGNTVILAEATGGVEIATLTPPQPPVPVGSARNLGLVRHVKVAFPGEKENTAWVFAAVDGKKLQILKFAGSNLELLGPPLPLAQDARTVVLKPGSELAYVVEAGGYLQALDITAENRIREAFRYVVATFWSDGIRVGGMALLVSGMLFILWMGFFAQFVLPVRVFDERFKAWRYLLLYSMGKHGPAIFVEDGKRRESEAESLRDGPAVMLLDTASAAVLETPGGFTRPVGPGVAFLKKKERSAGEVDLHPQTQAIGPKGDVDVFSPRKPDEDADAFQARMKARDETLALTRDGIPLVPNIVAVFKLDTEEEDLQRWPTRFGYRPESVWKAIVGEGVDLDAAHGKDKQRMAWNGLPAYLAVEVWREYARKFTLEELFLPKFPPLKDPESPAATSDSSPLTGMEVIARQVAMHFQKEEVPVLDGFGRYQYDENGKPVTKKSLEFEITRSRGLQVYAVVIANLRLPPTVEEQFLRAWQSTVETQVGALGGAVERVRIREADVARMNALVEYALWSSETLYQRLQQGVYLNARKTLETMLEDLRRHIAEELNLRRRMTTEWDDLQDLLDWIRMG